MGTPKGDTKDEVPPETLEQRQDPDPGGRSALTAEVTDEKGFCEGGDDTVKSEAGSDALPRIQTPNRVLPSSQSNQENADFSVRSDKSLDKLQPRRNPETNIHVTHSSSGTPEKPSGDGFNWRKYGQKFVKGNEFVRSYYRCTHVNCFAKKQVERSNAGQITDINYIGEHEHPRPHMLQIGASVVQTPPMQKPELFVVSSPEAITRKSTKEDEKERIEEDEKKRVEEDKKKGVEEDERKRVEEDKKKRVKEDEKRKEPGLCIEPLAMIKPEVPIVGSPKAEKSSDSPSPVSQSLLSKTGAPNSPLAQDSLGDSTRDEIDNTSGPDLKRQKIDISPSTDPGMNKPSSEPRQVVQTMSEVDLVSDGYRWRKYGQKLVKGNPNPRSYYRCSNAGCPVKKHVERASHDPKLVITTYEGQHSHEMPFTRTITQNTSEGAGVATVIGESRSSETAGNKTKAVEMVVHISAN